VETHHQCWLREQQEALLQATQQGHLLQPMNPAVLPQQLQGMQNQLPVNLQGVQQPSAGRAQAGAAAQGGAAAAGGAQLGAGAQEGAGQVTAQIPHAPMEQVQGVLDFIDRNQFQAYMLGIKLLSERDKFECKEENLKNFLDTLD